MESIAYTKTYTLTYQQIANALAEALGGGSDYWVANVRTEEPTAWSWRSKETSHDEEDYPLNPGGALFFTEDGEDHEVRLDMAAIQRGFAAMVEHDIEQVYQILGGMGDDNTGDIFLQCCLFGEVVYA